MAQWSIYTKSLISNWVTAAGTAAFCYDYFLTLDSEVRYVWTWKPKWSMGNVLFWGFRYSALFNTTLIVLSWAHPASWVNNSEHCTAVTLAQISFNFVLMCSAAVFSALRVYAVTGRNIWLSLITCALALVYPATVGYSLIVLEPSFAAVMSPMSFSPGLEPCSISIASPNWSSWMIGSRASAVASDGFILIVTWLYTRKPAVLYGETESTSVTTVLMRDTALYFGALFIINVLGILFESMESVNAGIDVVFATLTPLFTAIILSHLMFDLRAVSSGGGDSFNSLSVNLFATFTAAPPGQGEEDVAGSSTNELASRRRQWADRDVNTADIEMLVIS